MILKNKKFLIKCYKNKIIPQSTHKLFEQIINNIFIK